MNPTLSQLYIDLAAVLRQQGDLAAAANCYRRSIAMAPDAETYYRLGLTLFEQEQWQEAVECYEQAIALWKLGGGYRGSRVEWAIVHSNLGCALVRQGKLKAAIAQFQQGLRLAPNRAALYVNLGQAIAQQGRDRAAIACLERSIELEPTGVAACWQLAQLRQQQECWLEAIALWQRVVAQSPSSSAAWGELAIAQMAQGSWQQAIDSLRCVVRAQPEWIDAFCQQTQQSSSSDAWIDMQRSTARFLASLQSIETNSLQLLAETYLCRAKLLWQYGGDRQIQQADRDFAQAQRIAQAENLRLALPVRSIEQPTPPQGVYPTAAAWFTAVRPQGAYLPLSQTRLSQTQLTQSRSRPTVSSVEACAGLNCAPCLEQLQRQFAPVHLGQGTYACSSGSAIEATPLFVAQIPQGRAWAVPQINDWRICNAVAVLTPEDELLADLSRDYPGQLPNCRQSAPHRIWTAERSAIEPIAGTVAAIAGLSGHVYFHWMVDILPRLDLIRQSGYDWQAIDRFWLNGNSRRFQRETLAALGISAAKVLSSDRHPHIQAETLIAPSFVSPLGWASADALNFLRQHLPIAAAKNWPSRIYISRQSARYRRVLNEEAVLDVLRPAGFVAVSLESLSVAEQVSLFAQAEAIVAPHGSGLTNLAFCRPQTAVIELFSPDYVRPYYWAIAHHLQLRHSYALGKSFACRSLQSLMHPNPLTADILVNLAALKQLLKTVELHS
ncbi:DUF563 domain-containing protein [Microcoleus sp. FACHB-1515]|uniref:glycosyltransferase 61 family protein n=1 Tax=Cyanophyceae TaxID=3028117 RepID=UPI0016825B90|nr:glycosyltransferase 61 family protein [Microcoleus sp. FACHB-1515]MBD2088471.1 DUF563 domain-containing protein [Microcoleus sp. FACHB-1515]